MFVCIVLSLLIVTNVISQQQICVPIGTCPTRPTNPEDVDPRVVTPVSILTVKLYLIRLKCNIIF